MFGALRTLEIVAHTWYKPPRCAAERRFFVLSNHSNRMNILIVGGGTIGRISAEYFSKEGHSVTVVESNPDRIRILQDQLDIVVVEGRGTDQAVLQSAHVEKTELFLALTDSDESNIIACTLAKFAGVPRKIARINDMQVLAQKDTASLQALGVDDIVNTGESIVQEMLKIAAYPGMTDVHHYLDNRFVVCKFSFAKNSPHAGKMLKEITLPEGTMRLAYEQVGAYSPYDGDVRVNEFLYLYCACEEKLLSSLHAALSPGCAPIKNVMIYGSGYKSRQTGGALGQALMERGVSQVELLEEDREEARKLSAKFPFKVINDDPTLPHFERAGHFHGVDLFLGIASNFEKNLYACSIAHRQRVPHTVAFVRYPEHTSFVSAIPVMEFMNPALVTANKILKYHQADTIVSRTILEYGQAECLEFVVRPQGKFAGKALSKLPFKKSQCIALLRGSALLPADAGTVLQPQDRLLLLVINGEIDTLRSHL